MSNYPLYPYTNFHELNADWILESVSKGTEDTQKAQQNAQQAQQNAQQAQQNAQQAQQNAQQAQQNAQLAQQNAQLAQQNAQQSADDVRDIKMSVSVAFDDYGFAYRAPNDAEKMAIAQLPAWAKEKLAGRLDRVYFHIFYNEDAMGQFFITGITGGFPVSVAVKEVVRWEMFVGYTAQAEIPTFYHTLSGFRPINWEDEKVITPATVKSNTYLVSGYWWGYDLTHNGDQLPFIMTDFEGTFFESGGNPIIAAGQSAFPRWPFPSTGNLPSEPLCFMVTQNGIIPPANMDISQLTSAPGGALDWGLKGIASATINSMFTPAD